MNNRLCDLSKKLHNALDSKAQEIFSILDPEIKTSLHLVIVSKDKDECDETNEIILSTNDKDKKLHNLIEDEFETHSEQYSSLNPESCDGSESYAFLDRFSNKLANILRKYNSDQIYFVSEIKFITFEKEDLEALPVYLILQLDKKTYNKFYHLNLPHDSNPEFDFEVSLLSRIAKEYIHIFEYFTYLTNIPCWFSKVLELVEEIIPEEVIQNAAKSLMAIIGKYSWDIPSNAIFSDEGFKFRGAKFYNLCNKIAILREEGKECFGSIFIAPGWKIEDSKNYTEGRQIFFPTPVDFGESDKYLRKLFEIASKNIVIVAEKDNILGFCDKKYLEIKSDDLFEIKFLSHGLWDLCYNNKTLMRVSYGMPYLIALEDISKNIFSQYFTKIFSKDINHEVDLLFKLIQEVINDNKGTTILISNDIKYEKKKFKKYLIHPLKFSNKNISLISNLTNIDGAIILDTQGYCHAIGVILDGTVSDNEDKSRGSRYNSAIRYIEQRKSDGSYPCFIIVLSVDGTINYIPDYNDII